MAAASYDQLLRQVEVLKMENSNLRQELQDNSNHLTKLETEASNMKVGGGGGVSVSLSLACPLSLLPQDSPELFSANHALRCQKELFV